ncbi:MAG: 30S ribosomal protein S5 [Kiritimatiellia bacterium]
MSAELQQKKGSRFSDAAKKDDFDERTVFVNRCSKVVKGGRRFSFSAIVVVGDRAGKVGLGFGKANEVGEAIRKGGEAARRAMTPITLKGQTIPHEVSGFCDGGHVLLKPAPEGTGVIAGGGMRPVLEAAGISNVVGKSLGSNNRLNVVKATLAALAKLRSAEEIAAARA